MRRFNYGLAMVTLLLLAAVPAVAQSIFVSNDEWIFSQPGLLLYDDTQFAENVALWLTGGKTGQNILILSSNFGLNNSALVTLLNTPPVSDFITVTTTVPASFAGYQAVYVSGNCTYSPLVFSVGSCSAGFAALDAALATYVNNGGSVFLEAGLTCHEDRQWNAFLNQFGMSLADSCNTLDGEVNVTPFQTQPPYGPGLFTNVNNVYISIGENVQSLGTDSGVQIFTDPSGNGLYGAWQPACKPPNLLLNGSFEDTNFTSWTTGGNFEYADVVTGPYYVYSGAENLKYYAVLGPIGSDGSLGQSFLTTAGAGYNVCFWLNAVGDSPSDFSAAWDGTLIFSQTNPTTGNVWREFSFLETGTGYDSLIFTFRDDPAWIALDNVQVALH
jgi:hypothetical protein